MGEAFRLGGWGMYPTLIAGVVLVACALGYAVRPDARRFRIVRNLSVLTFLVGALGCTSGVIKAFTSSGDADPRELPGLVVVGFGESLCNIGLALVALVMAWIAASVGAYRSGSAARSPAEIVDPHAR
jgi:hypothetical protein